MRLAACLATAVLLAAAAAPAEDARVARGAVRGVADGPLVFFLPAGGKAGAVAVGAAHAFDPTRLAEVGLVGFLAPGGASAATSRRYFATPGRSLQESGATPRDDYLVFALDAAPAGVQRLEPAPALPEMGARVLVVGSSAGGSEATLAAKVVKSTEAVIELELGAADLRGWGGAPVIAAEDGKVLGLLESAWPTGGVTHASVAPIGAAAAAIASPYDGGLGRLFATLAPRASAANSPTERRRAAAGTPFGDLPPSLVARRVEAAVPASPPPVGSSPSALRVTIETPEPETIFGSAAGAFVAGRALLGPAGGERFDVFLVLDTSRSTIEPSGVDVDGDGQVGVAEPGPEHKSSDPGDSILAAEVAAAKNVVDGLDPMRTRVGLISFAGEAVLRTLRDLDDPPVHLAALTQEPLTTDYRRVRDALDELARSEPLGATHMAAGIDLATLELLGLPGSIGSPDPDSTKMILFFTDGQPTLPYVTSPAANVGAVLKAAERAGRAGIRIHSFAIGPDALAGPIATVAMAQITQGLFTPVPDPGRLSEFVDAMRLTDVQEVTVRNATAAQDAHEVQLHADGSWEALVPLAVGKNLLAVSARSGRGDQAHATLLVHYAPGSAAGFLPAELIGKYNVLLQHRVVDLATEQREKMRKQLVLEIEHERAAALERAAQQRKELEIKPVGSAPPEP